MEDVHANDGVFAILTDEPVQAGQARGHEAAATLGGTTVEKAQKKDQM